MAKKGFLKAQDAINGKDGWATMVYTDPKTGKEVIRELFEIRTMRATITKQKSDFKALGSKSVQHKATGWSGTGSIDEYYVSSAWAEMMSSYIKEGKDIYFTITFMNYGSETGSNIGDQTITLKDCNIDNLDIAALDVDAEWLTRSLNFTFSDIDIQKSFTPLDIE